MAQSYIRSYYDAHAKLGKRFLHPGGRRATEDVLLYLPQLGHDSLVVELGCGLGSTAKLILERFPCRYVGLDGSPDMLSGARRSLHQFSDRAKFVQLDLLQDEIPLPSQSAHAIIAESVVAILHSRQILKACHRVLRQGSLLLLNDRIWGKNIPADVQKQLNIFSENLYGHQLAPEDLATAEEWEAYLNVIGLKTEHMERIKEPGSQTTGFSLRNRILNLLNVLTHPRTLPVVLKDREVARQYAGYWKAMENWMFVARRT